MAVSVYLTHIRWFVRDFYVKNDGDGRYKFFPFSALSSIRIYPRVWHGVWVNMPHEIVLAQLKVDERHFFSEKNSITSKVDTEKFQSLIFCVVFCVVPKVRSSVRPRQSSLLSFKVRVEGTLYSGQEKKFEKDPKVLLGNLKSCKINIFHFHSLAALMCCTSVKGAWPDDTLRIKIEKNTFFCL